MITPICFSNALVKGPDGAWFDCLLWSLRPSEGTQYDVLAFVRSRGTGERTVRLFEFEPSDAHVPRAVDWLLQLTGNTEPAYVVDHPEFRDESRGLMRAIMSAREQRR